MKKIASLVVVPLILLLWAQFGAQKLTEYSFNALVKYPSPYLAPLNPGKDGDPIAKQVVIVVVDALRADASRTMPTLNSLRAQGADRTLQVGLPSFSLPGWTVIGTGAWQEQSGVTLNFYSEDVKLDTIFEAAKRKGLTTAIAAAGTGWKQLYPRGVDVNYGATEPKDYTDLVAVRQEDDQIEAMALKILKENKPNLLLVHFVEPDDAGHAQGTVGSSYQQAITTVDTRIAHLNAALDLSQAVFIVTADHGQIDQGGHGGGEPQAMTVPLVAVGKSIQTGQYNAVTQANIAPTLAVLLGTSIPAHNQGQPLFDMLTVDAKLRATRAVDAAQQVSDRYAQIVQVLGGTTFDHKQLDTAKHWLETGDIQVAYTDALGSIQASQKQAAAARDARFASERLARLPIALLIMLPFVVYLVILLREKWNWRIPIVGMVVYTLIYNALFFGRGLSWSLSMFNDESQIVGFFEARTIDAMLALVLATLAVGILSRRQGVYETALNTVNMAFFVAWVLAFQIDLFYWLYDIQMGWYIPDIFLGVKFYLDLLQTSAFWPILYVPLLVLLPFIALGTRWVTARVPVGR